MALSSSTLKSNDQLTVANLWTNGYINLVLLVWLGPIPKASEYGKHSYNPAPSCRVLARSRGIRGGAHSVKPQVTGGPYHHSTASPVVIKAWTPNPISWAPGAREGACGSMPPGLSGFHLHHPSASASSVTMGLAGSQPACGGGGGGPGSAGEGIEQVDAATVGLCVLLCG